MADTDGTSMHTQHPEGPDVVTLASELIRIDTTNRGGGDGQERPAAEYVAERLAEAGIESTLVESAPGRANLVTRVAGTEPGLPGLLVHGHLDVVPADPTEWSVDPFSGEIRDGMVWGRGAVDMKDMVAMMLTVARGWGFSGRRPRRDVVFAFTADEEDTAAYGAGWLAEHRPELFEGCTEGISESGGYTFHANGRRLYPVGAGERGTAWLKLTAHGTAGHGSKVNRDNAVGALAAAIARIDAYEWPVRLSPTVRAALAGIGRALDIPVDLDDPEFDVDALLDRFGPARHLVETTVRNSANPTMPEAGYKVNVIPELAAARVDGRVVPGAREEFEKTIDMLTGPRVDWEYYHTEIPLSAPVDSPTFLAMAEALRAEDPDADVVPYCMGGGTDAKQFSRLGITGYGFAPLLLPPDLDLAPLVHGVDERVPVEGLRFGARVLDRFLSTVG
ncbi:M20/M25/M40 family metallo-hydrolase [Phytoactinopolyspora alkaliphila]|uniref:M20/M25/M40 family metallo-hydrolase n=1 Tax=Phytoactinopolyspora alkaliphila TaxID=1783498 RepID=A0A6N9YPS7_9ACTN|nr:M20/M25/M40 family metallo-hydrolase [Phytoactinopolyspora alkaliphila]NED96940.1 M20/M25/M40 family metallo-hydrolase [Phytoactinopolyspora alkaliphila]